jgi:hypothetical protein
VQLIPSLAWLEDSRQTKACLSRLGNEESSRRRRGRGEADHGVYRAQRALALHRMGRRHGGAELYDHGADPEELENLAKDAARADMVAEMKRALAGVVGGH